MSSLYNTLVSTAKSLRETNHVYIGLLASHPITKKELAKYKRYMKQNLKEACFYLKMAKAEKEYAKNVKALRSGDLGTDH